jgi:hypothetical protein
MGSVAREDSADPAGLMALAAMTVLAGSADGEELAVRAAVVPVGLVLEVPEVPEVPAALAALVSRVALAVPAVPVVLAAAALEDLAVLAARLPAASNGRMPNQIRPQQPTPSAVIPRPGFLPQANTNREW